MIRGVYAVAASMRELIELQARLSNNLANLNTPAFKQELPILTPIGDQEIAPVGAQLGATGQAIGPLGFGVYQGEDRLDLSQGPLEAHDNPLALAINGEGFFRVQTPEGERFTRDGNFGRDAAGYLVNSRGDRVLGEAGPIQLPEGDVTVTPDGSIWVAGAFVGRLALATFAGPEALTRAGDGLFVGENPQPAPPGQARILQGYIERSNVDVAATLILAMTALKTYEASQRMLKMQDEQTGRLMDLARFG